jgi:hypothetical protein
MKRLSDSKSPLRTRSRTRELHRIVAPRTEGSRAALEWLDMLGLASDGHWYIEIALDVVDHPASATYSGDSDTRFHLNVYPEEWGVFFCHGSRASWIRITDEPFVHGRDDHHLLGDLPSLRTIGDLISELERRYAIAFRRNHALVRTNVVGGKGTLRKWLSSI